MLKGIALDTLTNFPKSNSKTRYSKKIARAIITTLDNSIACNLLDIIAYTIRKHTPKLLEIKEEST